MSRDKHKKAQTVQAAAWQMIDLLSGCDIEIPLENGDTQTHLANDLIRGLVFTYLEKLKGEPEKQPGTYLNCHNCGDVPCQWRPYKGADGYWFCSECGEVVDQ